MIKEAFSLSVDTKVSGTNKDKTCSVQNSPRHLILTRSNVYVIGQLVINGAQFCCVFIITVCPPSPLNLSKLRWKSVTDGVLLFSLPPSLSLLVYFSPAAEPDYCLAAWFTVHSYTNAFPKEFASQSSFYWAPQSTAVLVQQQQSEMYKGKHLAF